MLCVLERRTPPLCSLSKEYSIPRPCRVKGQKRAPFASRKAGISASSAFFQSSREPAATPAPAGKEKLPSAAGGIDEDGGAAGDAAAAAESPLAFPTAGKGWTGAREMLLISGIASSESSSSLSTYRCRCAAGCCCGGVGRRASCHS